MSTLPPADASGASYPAGADIGCVMGPLINYQSSGFPALTLTSRLIFARGSVAATDFADVWIKRTSAFSGGNLTQINAALRVGTSVGAADATQNWGLTSTISTLGTAGGLAVGMFGQATRSAGGSDPVWGAIADAVDLNDEASSLSGGAIIGIEVDVEANGADDATNTATFGGTGVRKNVQIVGGRKNQADVTTTEISNGLWFSSGTSPGETHVQFLSLIGAATNVLAYNGFDTRGITSADGNPFRAVTLTAGHVIDFDGGATLKSAPGRYLVYNSGSTKLQYMNAGTEIMSITDAGVMSAGGNTNFVTLTGAATSNDPIIAVGGGDTNRNLIIKGKGTGGVSIQPTVSLANGSTSFLQVAGGSTTTTLSAQGATNVDILLAPKGTGLVEFSGSQNFSANGSVATTMTSLGPTGSHTTIQEWLTIKNASGTTRYIPCY